MNVRTKFKVRSFTRSCAAKNWGGPWLCLSIPPYKKILCVYCPICLLYDFIINKYKLFIYVHSLSRDFRLQFWVRVANPQSWGRGGRMGSGMVPFERALVISYRPSIVTFPLSLRISEILPLLICSMTLFPYPTSSLPKISPCSPGIRWIALWLQRAKVLC